MPAQKAENSSTIAISWCWYDVTSYARKQKK